MQELTCQYARVPSMWRRSDRARTSWWIRPELSLSSGLLQYYTYHYTTMAVNVLVSAYHPFPKTISLSLPAASPARATLSYVLDTLCPVGSQSLSLRSGRPIPDDASFSDLGSSDVHVRLAVRLPGGKGGFGSQLRAAGGRMNSKKNGQNNTDSCRDLNGRRLSTIKEAKK